MRNSDKTYRIKDSLNQKAGTAWFVRTDLVVTAFHVVSYGDKAFPTHWMHEKLENVHYELDRGQGITTPVRLIPLLADFRTDLALLRCDPESKFENPRVLELSKFVDRHMKWTTDCYPKHEKGDTFALNGEIGRAWVDMFQKDSLQLDYREGDKVSQEGASGSPILDVRSGTVIGVLTTEKIETPVLKAANVAAVRRLLLAYEVREILDESKNVECLASEIERELGWEQVAHGPEERRERISATERLAWLTALKDAEGLQRLVEVGKERNFDKKLTDGLQRLALESSNTQTVYTPSIRINQAEQPPAHFVDRGEVLTDLKRSILKEHPTQHETPSITILYGMPGSGKTLLAQALAYDSEITDRFTDGVLWATLGQGKQAEDGPDQLLHLLKWLEALKKSDDMSAGQPTSAESAAYRLKSLLHDKRFLLIIDDVWDPAHARPFLIRAAGCQVLITTRDRLVGKAFEREGSRVTWQDAGVMTIEEAVELLAKVVGRSLEREEQTAASSVAETVGRLPLALALAAAQVRTEDASWFKLEGELRNESQRLKSLDDPHVKDLSSEEDKKRFSLPASLAVSLRRLDPQTRQFFAWLGALREDATFTSATAATLWETDPRESGKSLTYLYDKSLVIEIRGDPQLPVRYRLHDVLRSLAWQLLTTERIFDFEGLNLSPATAHAELLSRYSAKTQNGLWHTLKDDGYIHTQLIWHMLEAGRIKDVHSLLHEENLDSRNGWFETRDSLGDMAGYLADVVRAWQLAEKMSARSLEQGQTPVTVGLEACYALMSTSINSLVRNIPYELLKASVRSGYWAYPKALGIAQLDTTGKLLPALAQDLPLFLIPRVLNSALEIKNPEDRAQVCLALMQNLPQGEGTKLLPHILRAMKVRDLWWPADLLPETGPYLKEANDDEYFHEALDVARSINHEELQVKAIASLAQYLPERLRLVALDEALELSKKLTIHDRIHALKALHPYREELEWPDVVRTILHNVHIEDEEIPVEDEDENVISDNSSFRQGLIPLLTPPLFPETLDIISKFKCDDWKADALGRLARRLPQDTNIHSHALDVVKTINDEHERSKALAALAQNLPALLISEALKIAESMKAEAHWLIAMAALGHRLPEPQRDRVIHKLRNLFSDMYEKDSPRTLLEFAHRLRDLANYTGWRGRWQGEEDSHCWRCPNDLETIMFQIIAYLPYRDRLAGFIIGLHAPKYLKGTSDYDDLIALVKRSVGHLPEPDRGPALYEVLQTVGGAPDKSVHGHAVATVLKIFAPQLAEHDREAAFHDALKTARSTQSRCVNRHILLALLKSLPPHLSDADSLTAFHAAFEASETLDDPLDRGVVFAVLLKAFAGKIPEAEQVSASQKALQAVRSVTSPEARTRILNYIAPHMPTLLIPDALQASSSIQDQLYLVQTTIELARHLPQMEQNKTLEEALQTARAVKTPADRIRALLNLLPLLAREEARAVGKEVRQVANHIKLKKEKATLLAELALARHLRPSERNAVVNDALEAAHTIKNGANRFAVLVELAPCVAKKELRGELKKALDKIVRYHLYLPEDSLAKLPVTFLPQVWQALKRSEYPVLENGIVALAPRLPRAFILEALNITQEFANDERPEIGTSALSALGPRLPRGLIPRAWKILEKMRIRDQAMQREGGYVDALAAIAPRLPQDQLEKAFRTLLQYAKRGDRYLAVPTVVVPRLLSKLAKHLPKPMLDEAVNIARTLEYPVYVDETGPPASTVPHGDRAESLASLLPRLSRKHHKFMVDEVLENLKMADNYDELQHSRRPHVLTLVLPYLYEEQLPQALRIALFRFEDLRLEEDEQNPYIGMVDQKQRRNLLAKLVQRIVTLPVRQLHAVWSETLHFLVSRGRRELLYDLSVLAPIPAKLGEKEALKEMTSALQHVGRWWP